MKRLGDTAEPDNHLPSRPPRQLVPRLSLLHVAGGANSRQPGAFSWIGLFWLNAEAGVERLHDVIDHDIRSIVMPRDQKQHLAGLVGSLLIEIAATIRVTLLGLLEAVWGCKGPSGRRAPGELPVSGPSGCGLSGCSGARGRVGRCSRLGSRGTDSLVWC
jgi:hypothetical protein